MMQLLLQTSWWVPCYGLIGAVLTLPWSTGVIRKTGPRPAAYFNVLMTVLAFVHGLLLFRITWSHEPQELIYQWFNVPGLNLSLAFHISAVTIGAMELVTGLSLLAQLFALGYMEKDWALARFYALMGFFEGAMSGLAISDSLFLSYALLEMLTLSTYLLVGFWYAQPLVVTAARDAFLTKRVGDVLLLMGIVALATLAGDLNFPALYDWAETANLSPVVATLLGLALIAGPTGKCAQFPLHVWLDEAMEGPNPASILRNSVVVACGAYILIKLQPILILSPVALATLVGLGALTAVGASLVAIAQIDIKRALSYSTSAYLGLVFIAVGMGWTDFALFILLTHAVAKALLFMSVGSIIVTTATQDVTELGGLWAKMPATTAAFVVGSAGLVGLLPLGGFWALLQGIHVFAYDQPALVIVLLLVNGLTAFNLARVFRLVFLGQPQSKSRRAPEVPWPMAVPMVSLSIITLLVPLMLTRLSLLSDWSDLNPVEVSLLLGSGLLGYTLGGSVQLNRIWVRPAQPLLRVIQDLLAYDFYIDRLYRVTIVLVVDLTARLSNWVDRYLVDGIVNLVGLLSLMGSELLKYGVPGQSQTYVLTILVSLSAIAALFTWSMMSSSPFQLLSFHF